MLLGLALSIGALARATTAAPAAAQMNMPGMHMPMPTKPAAKKPAKKKTPAKKAPAKKAKSPPAPSKTAAPPREPEPTQPSKPMGMTMPTDHGSMPAQTPATPPAQMPMDHSQMQGGPASGAPAETMTMEHSQMGNMAMQGISPGEHGSHNARGDKEYMPGALGPYRMEREASGTAWQPDMSVHSALHVMSDDWTLMAHGTLNLVYDTQSGPRGADKAFVSGMLMGMARRPLGNGDLQFKVMLSPDPIMGPKGYPLLLASGETANGVDRLIDRQHPHDLFMELSASVSQNIGPKSSAFLYAGLPGEPAFGPPAFMHRESIMDSPEAPITHHWLDSTHITFGVVTAGLVFDRVKVEASRFNAREPDEHRWDIETGPLDSTSVRVSWSPRPQLALQGSWGHFVDPEQLEPTVDQTRWSVSAMWSSWIAPGWKLASTLAWGRKSAHGHNDDAVAAEASLKRNEWSVFGRAEWTENRELLDIEDGSAFNVGKVSVGAVRDFRIADHFSLGLGGLASVNFVPDALADDYGSHHPVGAMTFVRLKLD